MTKGQIWLVLELMLGRYTSIAERDAIISFLKQNLQERTPLTYRIKFGAEFWGEFNANNRLSAVKRLREDNSPWMTLGLAVDIVDGMRDATYDSKKQS
jgi:hypothetical protein